MSQSSQFGLSSSMSFLSGCFALLIDGSPNGIKDTMPTYYANTPIRLAIVLFGGTKLIDVCGPLQVFNDARSPDGSTAYIADLISVDGGPVLTDTAVPLPTKGIKDFKKYNWDTVLVSGGSMAYEASKSKRLLKFITEVAPVTRRIGSVCLGANILAHAGILKNKRATTHWQGTDRLAAEFPDTHVEEDAIYLEDDGVWTSAGVTAGIDMALAMVEQDIGRTEALRIAKSHVLAFRRTGGQKQYSDTLALQSKSKSARFDGLISYILEDLTRDLSVPAMAAQLGMSERNFSRTFTLEFGISPARFVERLRVDKVCFLIENENASIKSAAATAGFSSEEQLRRTFHRHKHISPSGYRDKFQKQK